MVMMVHQKYDVEDKDDEGRDALLGVDNPRGAEGVRNDRKNYDRSDD
jgi:hypothetical protein